MVPIHHLAALAALVPALSAHFVLKYPVTIGFDDDSEPTAPCGGFTADFAKNNVTDFHVGGESIATKLAHPQATFLYRATLDLTASGSWTQLFPIVSQSGLGDMCEPYVPAPAEWVGQKGILSVAANGPDGVLYQCAAVNFVSEQATVSTATCTNSSGVTNSFQSDAVLAALLANGTSNATGTPTTSSNGTQSSAKPAATSPHSAASGVRGAGWPLLASVVTLGMVAAGAVL